MPLCLMLLLLSFPLFFFLLSSLSFLSILFSVFFANLLSCVPPFFSPNHSLFSLSSSDSLFLFYSPQFLYLSRLSTFPFHLSCLLLFSLLHSFLYLFLSTLALFSSSCLCHSSSHLVCFSPLTSFFLITFFLYPLHLFYHLSLSPVPSLLFSFFPLLILSLFSGLSFPPSLLTSLSCPFLHSFSHKHSPPLLYIYSLAFFFLSPLCTLPFLPPVFSSIFSVITYLSL